MFFHLYYYEQSLRSAMEHGGRSAKGRACQIENVSGSESYNPDDFPMLHQPTAGTGDEQTIAEPALGPEGERNDSTQTIGSQPEDGSEQRTTVRPYVADI